jgi:hypothetical protein
MQRFQSVAIPLAVFTALLVGVSVQSASADEGGHTVGECEFAASVQYAYCRGTMYHIYTPQQCRATYDYLMDDPNGCAQFAT